MPSDCGTYHCNLSDVAKTVTLDVVLHGVKRFRVRMAIATVFLRMAAMIAPVQVNLRPIRECRP